MLVMLRTLAIFGVLLYAAFVVSWSLLRRWALRNTTVVEEVPHLGRTRPTKIVSGKAVIVGGSFAGLAAARICSDFFEEVVVVEPENFQEEKRSRIGQANQVHGFQAITFDILTALFPNEFVEEALNADARILPQNSQLMLGPGTLRFRKGSIPNSIIATRMCVEKILRKLTLRIPNVKLIQGTVTGVTASTDGSRIETVVVRPAPLYGVYPENMLISAALVADCTGAAAAGAKWLERASAGKWGPITKYSYDPKASYTTATVPFPARLRQNWPLFRDREYAGGYSKLSFIKSLNPGPVDPRMACLVRVEGDRFQLCVGGWAVPRLPTTMPELVGEVEDIYLKATGGQIPDPLIVESLRELEAALDEDGTQVEFVNFKMGPCTYTDYNTSVLPANFIALGDAILKVNPIYGQGVSKALIDAASLNETLRLSQLDVCESGKAWRLPHTFSKDFLSRQLPRILPMWESTKAQDYGRVSTIPCPRESLEDGSLLRRYLGDLVQISFQDKDVATNVILSLQLVAPGLDMMHPSLIARAIGLELWQAIKRKMASNSSVGSTFLHYLFTRGPFAAA